MSSVHVAPDAGGWAVKLEGFAVAVATFRMESEAVVFARDYARRHSVSLVVHFADGNVRFTERPLARGAGG
jgi:hypothetical protein